MGKIILFVLLLIFLTAFFTRVSRWFEVNKNINITPAAVIEAVAAIVFILTYGGTSTAEIVLFCVSIAIALIIVSFNLIKYGLKDGILASLAELIFSISAAFLMSCIFIAILSENSKKKKR